MNVRRIRPSVEEWLRENYSQRTMMECCEALGVSERTIFRWAAALGLPTRRELNAPKLNIGNSSKTVCRKSVLVNKCCYICDKYKKRDACELAESISVQNSFKLVCWDFELRKELK